MIRVLVVDDHTIFRTGLRRLLSDESDIRVVEEGRDIADMFAVLRRTPIDVVLLDVNMNGRSGLDAMPSLRAEFPRMPVLLLSMYPAEQYGPVALRTGASGYLTKDVESEELVLAIREVARGQCYVTSAVSERIRLGDAAEGPPHHRLAPREQQIMQLIVQGMSLTDIGARMNISVKTVSTYRTRILEKIGVQSNAELVIYAVRHHVLPC